MTVIDQLKKHKILPVVVLSDEAEAEKVLGALMRGGLPVAEITYRTAYAAQAIRYACNTYPDLLVGAGTVITGVQCGSAIAAGAKFIVSPGLSEEVAAVCAERHVPYFPGTVTPTEIMKAISLGITTVKYFPASQYGGLKAIRALSAAFSQVMFIPTGGIGEENINDYLAFEKIVACGGTWLLKGSANEIEEKTRRAVMLVNNK